MIAARARVFWFLALALVALKFWLVAAAPLVARGNAGYDDRIYLELAGRVSDGDWLGPYNQFTLIKGPMYPVFIALNFLLGLPLPLAQHAFYLVACALLVVAVRPWLSAKWPAFALFALLWLQPMSYVMFDVLRQHIYTPLTLLFFAGLIALETRQRAPFRVRANWALLLGLSAGAFYLTREEGVWIVPGVALLVAASVWSAGRAGLRTLLTSVAIATGCAVILIAAVCVLNAFYYNWFGTVEFRAPEFRAAYGALQRPIESQIIPFVPVTREVRSKLYDVSPAFAQLKLWLEGTIGLEWATYSEPLTGRPAEDREMSGGRFMWALREAVYEARHPRSAREALDFYDTIAREVNRACDEGRLGPVRPRRDSMIPPWRAEFSQRLRETAFPYACYFFGFADFNAFPGPSNGPIQELQIFRELTRWPLTRSEDASQLALPWQAHVDLWRLRALQFIGDIFRWICVSLALSGLIAWGIFAWKTVRRRAPVYLFVLTTAVLGSALAVMIVAMLVHVISFPNKTPAALNEGYPLLVIFGALAWIGATLRNYQAGNETVQTR